MVYRNSTGCLGVVKRLELASVCVLMRCTVLETNKLFRLFGVGVIVETVCECQQNGSGYELLHRRRWLDCDN